MSGVQNNKIDAAQIQQVIANYKPEGSSATVRLNIGDELRNHFARGNSSGTGNANVISKEKYTYKDVEGTLIKYDDGTAVFQAKKQVNGKEIVYELKFKNDKDLEKQRPSSQVLNPGQKNQSTTNFEYHRNGKVKQAEVYNAQGNLVKSDKYNKDGKLENRKIYDKEGKISQELEYKHNKDNSVDLKSYDKDHKLQYTGRTQYKPDGKTVISHETRYPGGELRSEIKHDDNGKIQTKKEYYENGKVKSETQYWDNGVIKEQRQYDENGQVTNKITAEIDGNFENSRQALEGDCYLMATINSIRNLDNGQEMLSNLVKVETNENGEKIYTVTLPGAQVAAAGLKTDDRVDPNKMHITGTYTFTEAEMQEILKQAGQKYSIGDGDVILLEAAFEKYRHEVKQTLDDNPELKRQQGVAGTQTGANANNILAGGYIEDASFILTGIRADQPYQVGGNAPYGLAYEDLQNGELTVVPTNKNGELAKAAVSEVDGGYTNDKEKLNKMLDDIMNDGKDGHIDNIASAGFRVVHADGTVGGHALTIKSVTEDTVTMINPWNPDKEITMSREDFIKSVQTVSVTDTTKPAVTIEEAQNGGATNPVNPNNPTQPTNPTNPTQPTNPGSDTPTTGGTYSVQRGDNMWKIAKKVLGGNVKNSQILNYVQKMIAANPQIKDPNRIQVGDKINLPPVE